MKASMIRLLIVLSLPVCPIILLICWIIWGDKGLDRFNVWLSQKGKAR